MPANSVVCGCGSHTESEGYPGVVKMHKRALENLSIIAYNVENLHKNADIIKKLLNVNYTICYNTSYSV